MFKAVPRCSCCKAKCPTHFENINRTPSRTVMFEGNLQSRSKAKDETREKMQVWRNAAPPMNLHTTPSPINTAVYGKYQMLMKSTADAAEDEDDSTLILPEHVEATASVESVNSFDPYAISSSDSDVILIG